MEMIGYRKHGRQISVCRLRPHQIGDLVEWIFSVDKVDEITSNGQVIQFPTAVTFCGDGYVQTEYEDPA